RARPRFRGCAPSVSPPPPRRAWARRARPGRRPATGTRARRRTRHDGVEPRRNPLRGTHGHGTTAPAARQGPVAITNAPRRRNRSAVAVPAYVLPSESVGSARSQLEDPVDDDVPGAVGPAAAAAAGAGGVGSGGRRRGLRAAKRKRKSARRRKQPRPQTLLLSRNSRVGMPSEWGPKAPRAESRWKRASDWSSVSVGLKLRLARPGLNEPPNVVSWPAPSAVFTIVG